MNIDQVLIRPLVTEKTSGNQEKGKYAFIVNGRATKVDVKSAIKILYAADVSKVNVILSPSKTRMVGRGREIIKRPNEKKVLITLKGQQSLDIHQLQSAKAAAKK